MKKIVLKIMKFTYFFYCSWLLLSINAHAYIDPSAVTYIIQAVAAIFIALGAAITVFRHKIFSFFKKNSRKKAKREIHMKSDGHDMAVGVESDNTRKDSCDDNANNR